MKLFTNIIMAILLSLSILAPAVMDIIDVDLGVEISENIGEEESEKEVGKELKEKKLIVSSLEYGDSEDFTSQKENSFYYLGNHLDLVRSIVLPPPEQA